MIFFIHKQQYKKKTASEKGRLPCRIKTEELLRYHIYHRLKDGVPCGWIFKSRIGEHATIPANVFDPTILEVLEPKAGTTSDIQFSIRIISWAMLTGFIM
jgi:hypothetical protein